MTRPPTTPDKPHAQYFPGTDWATFMAKKLQAQALASADAQRVIFHMECEPHIASDTAAVIRAGVRTIEKGKADAGKVNSRNSMDDCDGARRTGIIPPTTSDAVAGFTLDSDPLGNRRADGPAAGSGRAALDAGTGAAERLAEAPVPLRGAAALLAATFAVGGVVGFLIKGLLV